METIPASQTGSSEASACRVRGVQATQGRTAAEVPSKLKGPQVVAPTAARLAEVASVIYLVRARSPQPPSFNCGHGGCAAVEHQKLDLERCPAWVDVHHRSDIACDEARLWQRHPQHDALVLANHGQEAARQLPRRRGSGAPPLGHVLGHRHARDFGVQHVGIKVRVVGPAHGAEFGMDGDLVEERLVGERLEHTNELDHRRNVDHAPGAVVKLDAEPVLGKRLNRNDVSQHGLLHSSGVIRFSGCWSRARYQSSSSSCRCASAHSTTSPSTRGDKFPSKSRNA